MKLRINPDYPYVYEPHLHTAEGSKCASSTGAEMAVACYEAGYTGIFVTDHFYYGNTAIDRSLSWEDWVNEYCKGYEHAKAKGDEIGLQVFFGWESTYEGTDFLIYGLDKEWLLKHPEIRDASIPEQYDMVHRDNGMVIHAHPFRTDFYIPAIRLFPEYVDGVETVNATHASVISRKHNDPLFDVEAAKYAKQYGFPETAGSDVHCTEILFGGIAAKRKITSVQDYIKLVMTKEPYLLLNGNETANKK